MWAGRVRWRGGLPLAHFAAQAAVLAESLAVAVGLAGVVAGMNDIGWPWEIGVFSPAVVQAAITIALAIGLWDRTARFSLWGFYAASQGPWRAARHPRR